MGLCLDAARKLTVVEQMAGKNFKPLKAPKKSLDLWGRMP